MNNTTIFAERGEVVRIRQARIAAFKAGRDRGLAIGFLIGVAFATIVALAVVK